LILPPSPSGARGVFNKQGRTKLGDISIVTVAAYRAETGTSDVLSSARRWRIALSAVGPTLLRAGEAEAGLEADESPDGIRVSAELATVAARPISDIRAGANYRSAMVRVLTRRAIEAVLGGAAGGAA
jgi:CO/xanthine dehydrogenase FAD-binding subunit